MTPFKTSILSNGLEKGKLIINVENMETKKFFGKGK